MSRAKERAQGKPVACCPAPFPPRHHKQAAATRSAPDKMKILPAFAFTFLAAALASAPSQAQGTTTDGRLSPAQQRSIAEAIGRLHGVADRDVASQWSDAKKVAEVMCRPLALQRLRQTDRAIDRVFLGDTNPQSLSLAGNTLLQGTGQARSGNAWKTFSFACKLDPASGRASTFAVHWGTPY